MCLKDSLQFLELSFGTEMHGYTCTAPEHCVLRYPVGSY